MSSCNRRTFYGKAAMLVGTLMLTCGIMAWVCISAGVPFGSILYGQLQGLGLWAWLVLVVPVILFYKKAS